MHAVDDESLCGLPVGALAAVAERSVGATTCVVLALATRSVLRLYSLFSSGLQRSGGGGRKRRRDNGAGDDDNDDRAENGAPGERQLVLSHARGTVATEAQHAVCQAAAREASACVCEFFRQALERSEAPLEVPTEGGG